MRKRPMSKVIIWDIIVALIGIAGIIQFINSLAGCFSSSVHWWLVLAITGLGGFLGTILSFSGRIINRPLARAWIVMSFIGTMVLSLWPGAVAKLGFAVCLLVVAVGHFRDRLLSVRHPAE